MHRSVFLRASIASSRTLALRRFMMAPPMICSACQAPNDGAAEPRGWWMGAGAAS